MASYPPYIPPRDSDFAVWLLNFSTLLTANPTDFGLDAADALTVDAVNTTFQDAYTIAVNPTTRTTPTVAAKDVARASAEAVVRPFAVSISKNTAVTDLNKAAIGVTIPALVPTPIPAPTDAPTISLQSAISLNQLLQYKVAGQDGKSKPFGSRGVEVYSAIGVVAATDPAQTTFRGTFTKSPFRQVFDPVDQGKFVTYFARYVTASGPGGETQPGPWSDALNLSVM